MAPKKPSPPPKAEAGKHVNKQPKDDDKVEALTRALSEANINPSAHTRLGIENRDERGTKGASDEGDEDDGGDVEDGQDSDDNSDSFSYGDLDTDLGPAPPDDTQPLIDPQLSSAAPNHDIATQIILFEALRPGEYDVVSVAALREIGEKENNPVIKNMVNTVTEIDNGRGKGRAQSLEATFNNFLSTQDPILCLTAEGIETWWKGVNQILVESYDAEHARAEEARGAGLSESWPHDSGGGPSGTGNSLPKW